MHILIAPNAFKHSLTAESAAQAIQKGLQFSKLSCTSECFPIADGGDGTANLIIQRFGGIIIQATVKDPLGKLINSNYGLIDNGRTAVIEMANSSGLRLLKPDELNPLKATSFGTGQLMRMALDKGVSRIILGMGGSASIDGGCGILIALGARLIDKYGKVMDTDPARLIDLRTIDRSGIDPRIFDCEVKVLCDVESKLLGDEGAVAIFGPQKGADKLDLEKLESSILAWNNVTMKEIGVDMSKLKYGGTAGGAAASLSAYLKAELVNGADYFLQLTEFEKALMKSSLVITGEGSIDAQTLQGKGPFVVASKAKRYGVPVVGLAGKLPLERNSDISKYFDGLMAIGQEPVDIIEALRCTERNLIRVSEQIGNLIALGN
jgi:glycerate kinase